MLLGHGVKRLRKLLTHSRKNFSEFPILKRPDFSKVFILHTDWSALGISVILDQLDEKSKEYVIAYASQNNNKIENNYSSYEGECLTDKLAHWALILQEYEFKVIHRPGITHQNANTMSRRPLTTSEDFLEARQDFD
jgi:hypothetical protein